MLDKIYKFLCNFDLHIWKYKKEKHKIIGDEYQHMGLSIDIRECTKCNKRQHHMMPKSVFGSNWKNASFGPKDDIEIEKV